MKKLLALVLALVMTMSLVTISNAAFKDADSIDYKEAVEVMNKVGVLIGDEKGNFNAKDTLTRGQAAKIIAYLDLGGKTADAVKGTGTVFTDVKATSWYAGYVEYCAGAGYVAGVGGGKFDPEAKVTGVQFAKMLLCALGYKAEVEGYTGSDYTIAIARDANKNDLFDGLSIVTSANLTREQAAQMAFNALEATVVEYQGGTNVTTSDGTSVIVNATRNEVANKSYDYDQSVKDYDENGTQQLCEKLYGKDLKKTAGETDKLGRPATKWEYKGDEIGTYADTADKTYVVDDAGKTLKYFLTDDDYFKYSSNKADTATNKNSYLNGDGLDIGVDMLEKGDVISVYLKDNNVDTIEAVVVLRYTAAIIDDIDTDISKSQKSDGVNAILTLKDIDDNDLGDYYDTIDASASQKEKDKQLNGYLGTSYKKDAAIAIAQNAKGVIVDSYAINVVTGKVASAREAEYVTANNKTSGIKKGFVKVDGTTYNFAGSVDGTVKGFDFDKEYAVYTTAEGYVLAVDGAGDVTVDDVYYVTGLYKVDNNYGKATWYAQGVLLSDGTVKDIKLDSDFVKDGDDGFTLDKMLAAGANKLLMVADGSLTGTETDQTEVKDAYTAKEKVLYVTADYLYTFDSDGVPSKWNDKDYKVTAETLTDDMKKSDSRIKVNSKRFYVDGATKYVAIEDVGDDIDVTTAEGGMSAEKKTNVILIADGRDAKIVVYIAKDLKGAQEDIVYLTGAANEKNNDGWVKSVYFMDTNKSEKVTLKEKYDRGFYTYTINSDGVYELKAANNDELGKSDDLNDSDTEGWVKDMHITSRGGTMLSGTVGTVGTDSTFTVTDVEFGKALVLDDDNDAHSDAYGSEINSVSRLKNAIDKVGTSYKDDKDTYKVTSVDADVYVTDGEITFVYVTSMTAKTAK